MFRLCHSHHQAYSNSRTTWKCSIQRYFDCSSRPDDGYDVAETCRQYNKVCIKVYWHSVCCVGQCITAVSAVTFINIINQKNKTSLMTILCPRLPDSWLILCRTRPGVWGGGSVWLTQIFSVLQTDAEATSLCFVKIGRCEDRRWLHREVLKKEE
jgi:hypothetical protein